jgi:hypothetical protein
MSEAGGLDTNDGSYSGGYDGYRSTPSLNTALLTDTTHITRYLNSNKICWVNRLCLNKITKFF